MDWIPYRRVSREFWAGMLGVEVSKDGQVTGCAAWWGEADDELRWEARRVEAQCCGRVRDGVALVEAVAEATLRLKDYQRHRAPRVRARPDYIRFRLALRTRILDESLRPFEVAALLDRERDRHPEILADELEAYRQMRDQWQEWKGYDFDYAVNHDAWKNRGEPAEKSFCASEPPLSSG